jgi:hypothetical protein
VIARILLIFLQFPLGALPGIDIGLSSIPADDVPLFNCPDDTNESDVIRNLRLCPFGSLAKNPLAHIRRTMNQCNPSVLAVTQESYNLNVHKSDLTQVQEHVNVVIVHLSPYVVDIGRLNSATEPQARSVSVRLLFNPQHWLTIPFGRGRGLPIRDHGPPGEAVGIDNANPIESASNPDGR